MPYYLAPYIGTGADNNPFRPRQSDAQAGWSAIDLRPDPSVASGPSNVCLLWLPNPVVDGALTKIADSPDQIVRQSDCDQINNILGTSVTPGRFSDVVAEILTNPPPARWKALQPTRGRNVIWLNGRLHDSPAAIRGGAEGYDTFKRPNATDWGMQWEPYVSGVPLSGGIFNNRARENAAATQAEEHFEGFIPSSADCFAQARILTWNGGAGADSTLGVMIRGTAGPTREFYAFIATRDLSVGDGYQLAKRVAGAFTSLASVPDATPPPLFPFVANDLVQIEANGSSIQGLRTSPTRNTFREVLLGPVTDTSLASAGRAGMRVGNITSVADTEADAFLCGDGICPRKFLLTPSPTSPGPEENLRVDDCNRVENPLTDLSPVTGLPRWSLASTQPIFPDDDVSPSSEIQADGAAIRHCQFHLPKGCYRLDYLHGPEAQVGYELIEVPSAANGQLAAILRVSNPGTNSISGYFCDVRIRDHAPTNDEWRLFRIDPGSPYTLTQIGSSVFGPNVVNSDWVCWQAYKNKIRGWHRTAAGSWTLITEAIDSTYTGSGRAGFYLNGDGQEPGLQAQIDNVFIGTRRFILSH